MSKLEAGAGAVAEAGAGAEAKRVEAALEVALRLLLLFALDYVLATPRTAALETVPM